VRSRLNPEVTVLFVERARKIFHVQQVFGNRIDTGTAQHHVVLLDIVFVSAEDASDLHMKRVWKYG
jgi:hypothetical protein